MTDDSARAYRQATAFGASPVGQVVALYDALLRDLHKATTAIAAGHVESRVAAANHALTIIGELQGVLDFEHGGEPARPGGVLPGDADHDPLGEYELFAGNVARSGGDVHPAAFGVVAD